MLPRPTGSNLFGHHPACAADFRAFRCTSALHPFSSTFPAASPASSVARPPPRPSSGAQVTPRQLVTVASHCPSGPQLSPGPLSLLAPPGSPDLSATPLVIRPLTLPWLFPPLILPWAFIPPVLWVSTFSNSAITYSLVPSTFRSSMAVSTISSSRGPSAICFARFLLPSSGSSPAARPPPEPSPSLSPCRSVTVQGHLFPLRSVMSPLCSV